MIEESYLGRDKVAFHYPLSLEIVTIEDDDETQIVSRDVREFIDYLRDVDLDPSIPYGGVFQGVHGTIFQFDSRLSEVSIEDQEGRRIVSTCFRWFASMIRGRDFQWAMEENGLGHLVRSNEIK